MYFLANSQGLREVEGGSDKTLCSVHKGWCDVEQLHNAIQAFC